MIIDGRKLASSREALLRNKVLRFIRLNRRKPSLLAIELSADPGSLLYLKLKKAAAERIGIEFEVVERSDPAAAGSDLKKLSADGIFVQHPPRQKLRQLAEHLGGQAGLSRDQVDKFWQKLVDQIPPEKDVDCLTSENLNLIKQGTPRFLPATVKAVLYCLESLKRTLLAVRQGESLKYIVIGRSPILGLPLYWYLKNLGVDVTLLHSQSENIKQKTKTADILISAIGKPGIITDDMVKPGVIVIDAGSPKGDIDFSLVSKKAAAITPVPGGVGPLTVVSLMENVLRSAHRKDQIFRKI